MLKDILEIIQREGYISKSMLAAELKVPEGLIEDGLQQLERMGYLEKEETGEGCLSACTNCPFAKNCGKEIIQTYKMHPKE